MKKVADILIGALLGAIFGLILGVLFSEPLIEFLCNHKTFYFLDKEKPIVDQIFPDIISYNRIDKIPSEFIISAYDSGSGIDIKNSKLELWRKENHLFKKIECNVKKNKTDFVLKISNNFKPGEYKLKLLLTDKAKNLTENYYSFIFKEKDDFFISCKCRTYDETKENLFSQFFQKDINFGKEFYKFYILNLIMANKSETAIIRDMNFKIDMGGIIFTELETMNDGTENIQSYSSISRIIPEDKFFGSWKSFSIEKITPKGFFQISFLIGMGHSQIKEKPERTDIHGTYVLDGYGINEVCKLIKSIPNEYK